MGLLDLKTDLKSLKFGTPPAFDRPGGGNSNQPYITNPISSDIIPQSEDFLLRGGLNAPLDAANDVVRLTKMFGDLKSPSGLLFIAKQNLLSRIAVNTQASGEGVNEGVYTPLTTLAQAGVGFAGIHLSKQGLIPGLGVKRYGPKSLFNPQGSTIISDVIGNLDGTGNRLVDLYKTQTLNEENGFSIEDPVNVYTYPGGPGSTLGIGKTNIRFATDNKGAPLFSGAATKDYQTGLKYGRFPLTLKPLGVSDKWEEYTGIYYDSVSNPELTTDAGLTYEPSNLPSVYDPGTLTNSDRINDNGTLTLSQKQISDQLPNKPNKSNPGSVIQDFRKPLIDNLVDPKTSTIMSIAPSYSTKGIDGVGPSRIKQISPGQKGNKLNYSKGKIINSGTKDARVSVVDQINFQPIYKSTDVREDLEESDLVKFRIGAVLRTKGSNGQPEKIYTHFRAFINSFSDSYNAKWEGVSYMGRGEEFYKYGGFGRKISLSYTIAAQSKPELMAQYKKLNFLASTLAPDYGSKGYMGGVLTTLTLGGWCYELPGFIGSLSLEIPKDSPWEIGINEKGERDETVKELPHICNVSMDFTPIHNFRPELQTNVYDGDGDISSYTNQQYIALSDKGSNNYKPIDLKEAQTPK